MHVKSIQMTNFMRHARTEVVLPASGVIAVVGPNGGGKSSIVEAVATAGWGETLRGTPPWTGSDGVVSVDTDVATMGRFQVKGAKKLVWCGAHEQPETYETTTKAQAALEHIIGPFDVWRRTHVFSSQDAAHFTMSTDGERKRLLEAILGLYRFDAALAKCRDDRVAAEAAMSQVQRSLDQTKVAVAGARDRLNDAERILGALPAPVDVSAIRAKRLDLANLLIGSERDLGQIQTSIDNAARSANKRSLDLQDACRKAIYTGESALERASNEYQGVATRLYAQHLELERRLSELNDSVCDKCGQPITPALRDSLKAQALAARAEFDKAQSAAKEATDKLRAEQVVERDRLNAKLATDLAALDTETKDARAGLLDELAEMREENEGLKQRAWALDNELAQEAMRQKQRDEVEAAVGRARKSLAAVEESTEDLEEKERLVKKALDTLLVVESVLGLKGVRAHVLGQALSGIEQVSNSWLSRIAGEGFRLHLKPYTEKKTGGISDSISLEIEGAGGGYGYKASSGGERRRIDVALLLALAEVAQAAHGVEAGTLFLDEVFDALDSDGIGAVTTVLDELSEERAVVVITHSGELVRAMNPALTLRVAEGKIA